MDTRTACLLSLTLVLATVGAGCLQEAARTEFVPCADLEDLCGTHAATCATTFAVNVTEAETVFTVVDTSHPATPVGENLLWTLTVAPHGDAETWRGSFGARDTWPAEFEYRDQVAPDTELNPGDEFVVKRALEENASDPFGGYHLKLYRHLPQVESFVVGTYPACQVGQKSL